MGVTSHAAVSSQVAEIVPNTQPIIPLATTAYKNLRSIPIDWVSAHVIWSPIVWLQLIANQPVR
jgi:hypothetical protein